MSKLLKNMALKKIMSCSVVLFLLIMVDINGAWSISREEDLELERQLKILNKPGVKTIRIDDGEIFDCVDIHKQPSLDHPLLKNHKVQMTFDHFPKSMKDKHLKENESPSALGKGLGCPIGTVPIRRMQKEDLIRAKAFSKLHMRRYAENSHPLATDFNIFRSAKLVLSGSEFYGIQSYMNVYNPKISSTDQASSSLMYLASELDGNDLKSDISVGWTVNFVRYGDTYTHLFTYWTGDSGKTTGCYDLLCPGFILNNPNYTLGIKLHSSDYHGPQYKLELAVSQDPNTGHWWLIVEDTRFGYWPKELFGAFGVAKELVWGGEVFSARQPFPPMGSGHFPEEDFGGACYFRSLKCQYKAGRDFVDPETGSIATDEDNTKCYRTGPLTNRVSPWDYTFFFGGPGGQC